MPDNGSGIREQLEQDENIQRLLRSLSLATQFRLYIVYCNAPRLVTELLALIEAHVPAEREESIRLIRLNPHQKHKNVREPIPANLLIDEVLTPLVSPSEEMRDSSVIVVVDGSYAAPLDDDAWLLMFQRMNERRNVISQSLCGPLVLVLPKRLEMGFAHAAPDVWSIRSLIVTVRATLPEPVADLPMTVLPHAESEKAPKDAQPTENLEELESELQRARALVASMPDKPDAEDKLVLPLMRIARVLAQRGNHARAAGLMDEVLAIARRGHDLMPDDCASNEFLGLLRRMRAALYEQAGDVKAALSLLDEAVSFHRIAAQAAPDDIVVAAELLDVLEQRYELLAKTKMWDACLPAYEEARDIAQSLVQRDPTRIEWLDRLGTYLSRIGTHHLGLAQFEKAVHAFRQSVEYHEDFLDKQPEVWSVRKKQVITLAGLGAALWRMGEADRALESFEKAVAYGHELRKHLPDDLDVVVVVATSINTTGRIYFERRDLDRAMALAEEGVAYGREGLAPAPHDFLPAIGLARSLEFMADVHRVREQWELAEAAYSEACSRLRAVSNVRLSGQEVDANLARILEKRAKLTETRGNAAQALTFYREALSIVEVHLGGTEPEQWRDHAEHCRSAITRLTSASSE